MNFLNDCINVITKLYEILEFEIEEATEEENKLIIAFAYGILLEKANEINITDEEFTYAITAAMKEIFNYSLYESKANENQLRSNVNKETDIEKKMMIYQGKYMYDSFKKGDEFAIYNRLTNMIDIIATKEYENY